MSRTQIRHELSQLESNLRIEIGKLTESKQVQLNSPDESLCHLIAQLTELGFCEHPIFIQVTKLDAALCQLDIGLYGLCSDCESEIEAERLVSDPVEQRCGQCAENHEHEHRQELRLTH